MESRIKHIDQALDSLNSQLAGFDADSYSQDLDNMDLQELARLHVQLKSLNEKADAIKKAIGKFYDRVRTADIPERMDEQGMSSVRIEGVGQVKLTTDMSISVRDKEGLLRWMEENGYEGLIQEQVNTQQLKSTLNHRMKEGKPLPEDAVKINPFTRASVTK